VLGAKDEVGAREPFVDCLLKRLRSSNKAKRMANGDGRWRSAHRDDVQAGKTKTPVELSYALRGEPP
jgi:hypothetical protein